MGIYSPVSQATDHFIAKPIQVSNARAKTLFEFVYPVSREGYESLLDD